MSIKLIKGEVYQAYRFRSGASDKGRWEVVVVREKRKPYHEITIFPTVLPSGVREGGTFMIKDIVSVKRAKRKDTIGEWTLVDVSIEAEIVPYEDGEINLDGDLPFTMGAYDDEEPDDLDTPADINAIFNID